MVEEVKKVGRGLVIEGYVGEEEEEGFKLYALHINKHIFFPFWQGIRKCDVKVAQMDKLSEGDEYLIRLDYEAWYVRLKVEQIE